MSSHGGVLVKMAPLGEVMTLSLLVVRKSQALVLLVSLSGCSFQMF